MRPSNKLDFAKLEFFKIVKVLGLIMYKLDLSNSMRIIRIRHISVLELADLVLRAQLSLSGWCVGLALAVGGIFYS